MASVGPAVGAAAAAAAEAKGGAGQAQAAAPRRQKQQQQQQLEEEEEEEYVSWSDERGAGEKRQQRQRRQQQQQQQQQQQHQKVSLQALEEGIVRVNRALRALAEDEDFHEDLAQPIVQVAMSHWTGTRRLAPEQATKLLQNDSRVVGVIQKLQRLQGECQTSLHMGVPLAEVLRRMPALTDSTVEAIRAGNAEGYAEARRAAAMAIAKQGQPANMDGKEKGAATKATAPTTNSNQSSESGVSLEGGTVRQRKKKDKQKPSRQQQPVPEQRRDGQGKAPRRPTLEERKAQQRENRKWMAGIIRNAMGVLFILYFFYVFIGRQLISDLITGGGTPPLPKHNPDEDDEL